MPWFKVDDGFHGHPKVTDLSLGAVGLWALTGSWSAKYLTDGAITPSTVRRLGGNAKQSAELVSAGLWLPIPGGFQFKDWDRYQPLKAEVEAEREAAQGRMRQVRAKRKGVKKDDDGSEDGSGELQVNDAGTSGEVRLAPSQSLSPSPSLPNPIPPSVEPRKRGTRIPDPFVVTREMREWAAGRTPHVNVDLSTERFVNYWRARTRDATKLDWLATWHNWLLSDADKGQPKPRKKSKEEQFMDVLEMGRRLQAQEQGELSA